YAPEGLSHRPRRRGSAAGAMRRARKGCRRYGSRKAQEGTAGPGGDAAAHQGHQHVSVSSFIPRRHSPQRQDLSRRTGRVGREEISMKALVTGGGGFLGKAIVQRLLARGDQVRSFARGTYPELQTLGATVLQGDFADPEAVKDAAAGCDIVFHVAA